MGLFTRSDRASKPSASSLTAPPNVYTTHPPKLPRRPAIAQDHHHHYHQPQQQQQQQLALANPQSAGYLPPPSGWGPPSASPALATAPQQHPHPHPHQPHYSQQHQPHQPHQHQHYQALHGYHNGLQPSQSQPQLQRPSAQPLSQHGSGSSSNSLDRWTTSMVNLARDARDFVPIRDMVPSNCSPRLFEDVYNRFNDVMTLIDNEKCSGNEDHLFAHEPSTISFDHHHHDQQQQQQQQQQQSSTTDRVLYKPSKKAKQPKPHPSSSSLASAVVTGNYFSKVELYDNSKLPAHLPPLALYMPTWPLLCLAAQYAQRVYEKPTAQERDETVSADWRTGSKAMCIKSVPMDHASTIVFAIRGTATFMDWAVNLKSAPAAPTGFLDDDGNYCHAGFLSVARSMVRPVAARLRQMLQEDPGRAGYSLLMTGHSAGGAVAALLYTHMLSASAAAESELTILAGCFKRIHCVTFGAPPVSLLPLTKPDRPTLRKSLFLSFVNEGDPVVRADKPYVKSLLELLASPPPPKPHTSHKPSKPHKSSKSRPGHPPKLPPRRSPIQSTKPTWPVPPSTLSNAGRIVVLRAGSSRLPANDRRTVEDRVAEGVVAVTCPEDQLRGMIWGDPVSHLMGLYAARIEVLAVGAVTAKKR